MDSLVGIGWGSLGFLSWGVGDYLARSVAVRARSSLSAVVLVQAAGLLLPVPFVIAQLAGANAQDIDWGRVALWAPLSAALLSFGYVCYYTGLHRGTVSVVTSAASAWLAVTVVVTVVFFGEHVTAPQVALMALALAGILTMSTQPRTHEGHSAGLWWGVGAMAGLGGCLALMDQVSAAAGPMLAVLLIRAITLAPSYLYMRVQEEPLRLPSGRTGLLLVLAAGTLDAGGFVSFNLGVEAAPVALVAPILAAHPVMTTAMAVALLRERPRRFQWTGAAVTVAAVIALSALAGV